MTVNEIERRNFFSRLENESQPLKINEIKHENVVYMQISSKININFFILYLMNSIHNHIFILNISIFFHYSYLKSFIM